MKLDENRFSSLANEMLERIADAVDETLGDKIDAELSSGVLTLTLETGGQYVINKQAPNRQIWLSSPIGGAFRFDWIKGQWISARPPHITLHVLLEEELKTTFGVVVEGLRPPGDR